MTEINNKPVFLLTVLVLVAFISACAAPEPQPEPVVLDETRNMREAITTVVAEPERQTQLNALVDQIDKILVEHKDAIKRYGNELRQLNGNYDAPRIKFDKAIDEFNFKRNQAQSKYLDLRYQMIGQTKQEEWNRIAAQEEKIIMVLTARHQARLSLEAIQKKVNNIVEYQGRKDILNELLTKWIKLDSESTHTFDSGRQEVIAVIKKSGVSRDEIQQTVSRLDRTVGIMDRTNLDMRFRLNANLGRVEWNQLVD